MLAVGVLALVRVPELDEDLGPGLTRGTSDYLTSRYSERKEGAAKLEARVQLKRP